MVEHRLPKPRVAGSSPVFRSGFDGEQPKFGCSLFFLCLCSCKPDHHPKNSAALQPSPSLQRQGEYLMVAGIELCYKLGLSTCAIWHPRFTSLWLGGRTPFPAPDLMASNQSLVVRCFLCLCSCKPDHHPKNSVALQLSPSLPRQGEYLRVAGIEMCYKLGLSTCAIWHPRFTTLARGGRTPFPAPDLMASNQSLVVRCFLMCVICWLDIAYCQL